jgi:2,4-diaminopentanoate dehydrogenase
MGKLRVIQWGTGSTGRHGLRAILTRPDMELAGVYVAREENAGRDAGELAGLAPCGVTTTSDKNAILALDADCVFHAARASRDIAPLIDEICGLLGSGKNVITIAASPLIYPKSLGDAVVAQLEAACRSGGTSFHGTGIEPGWAAEVLPITLSGLLYKVERMTMREIMDYTSYDNAQTLFDAMGFGRSPDADGGKARGAHILANFAAPLMMIAEATGAKVDGYVFHFDTALTDRTFTIPAGEIAAGTVSAMRFGVSAMIEGRAAMMVEHITRVGKGQAPDWPQGRGWRLDVEGVPSFRIEADIAINPGEDDNEQACLATAMHALNAIPHVCAAAPGIRTFLDLPMIAGRNLFD